MSNYGKNTNGSQFFLTFDKCPWLDGRHVVFGEVTKGKEFVDYIHKKAGSNTGKPKVLVSVINCGEFVRE